MNRFLKKAVSMLAAAALSLNALAVTAFGDGYEKKKLPDNEAIAFVEEMGVGWNLGNAFDAVADYYVADEMDFEKIWCGAKTTKELIKKVAASGFKSIRIPVSWRNHVDKNFNISEKWMNRVKEVVDWSIDEGLYVIINIHHDVKEGFYYPSTKNYSTSEKYLKKIWTQICEVFKDYDEKLVFETINEPRLTGTNFEWWYNVLRPEAEVQDALECINKLNQVAVDTIRSCGGNNKNRYIMVPGYDTDGGDKGAMSKYFKMPKDSVKNRLILAAHIYSIAPKEYTKTLDGLYDNFVAKGIPVSITEYGLNSDGYNNKKNTDIAVKRMGDTAAYARSLGISLVVWDNNYDGVNGFQLINRATATVTYPEIVKALVENGTVQTDAPQKSAVPKVTVKTGKTSSGKNTATLSWDKVEGTTKYRVYKYSNGKYSLVKKELTKTSYKISGLKSGSTYKYLVLAYVDGKWTKRSVKNLVTVKIK